MREKPGIRSAARRPQRGLRWKFNAALLPVVALTVALLVWLDYRHERQAVMAAHALHVEAVGAVAPAGPIDPATSPEAVARRTLVLHAVYAVALLSLIAVGLNTALSRFVLMPIDVVRNGIEQMQRRHWRMPAHPAAQDEVGRMVESFGALGLAVDALVTQLLHTERRTTLAVVANNTAAQIEPRLQRIGAAVGHLQQSRDETVRDAAEEIATATADILAAVRGLDRLFEASLSGPGSCQAEGRTEPRSPVSS